MKILIILTAAVGLCSCNTSIGLYRDTKAGFNWTKEKIQGAGNGGGGSQGGGSQGGDYIY
jgi:predicted small secreted protein